jgi:hypothetical protein
MESGFIHLKRPSQNFRKFFPWLWSTKNFWTAQEELLLILDKMASRRDFAKIKSLSDVLSFSVECPYLLSKLLIKVPAFNCRRCEVFELRSARTNVLLMSPLYQMVNSCSTKADSNKIDIFFIRPSELRSVLTYAS